ncbi:hypothetical protein CEE37_05895 [candidate division LCP-89 bacterium B3_LCP]|uniref:Uncharacterized protein n=1 Tax=candidate division LCP-89 bacterium B3_LCP TaxID=2012998 RepID=A0A532V1V9_UNCL8|nr:MAG: hypothetical protein CEE37_05895 [candidate division LCP-89 bacterium B3_LCP]
MAPTNPENFLRQIKDPAFLRKCVVFIGAGLSIPPGKRWDKLVREIATKCVVEVQSKTNKQIIDDCLLKPDAYKKAFRELFPKYQAACRTALPYILHIEFKAYITTNFGPYLRNLASSRDINRVHVYPDLPLNHGLSKAIYYIHGCYDSEDPNSDPEQLIFGFQSFEDGYGSPSLLPGFLLSLFTYENILFLGFDPLEEKIRAILEESIEVRKSVWQTNSKHGNTGPKRYVLWPSPLIDNAGERAKLESTIEEFKALDLDPITYDPIYEDYSGLEKLLHEIIAQEEFVNRPPPFTSGFDL